MARARPGRLARAREADHPERLLTVEPGDAAPSVAEDAERAGTPVRRADAARVRRCYGWRAVGAYCVSDHEDRRWVGVEEPVLVGAGAGSVLSGAACRSSRLLAWRRAEAAAILATAAAC